MKRMALQLMRDIGLFAFSRRISAGHARILMYHNFSGNPGGGSDAVNVAALRDQLTYLREHFHVVPLNHIVECLTTGRPLDKFAVALTVDDGRRNFYQHFFPLLEEFALPATFFVVSSFIRCEDWLWTDKVLWLSEQPSAPASLYASEIEGLFRQLNRMRPEIRNAQISAMAAAMSVAIPKEAPERYAPCSWAELREMVDSGLVEIGSHTVSHPVLASITDAESWEELTLSRVHIQEGIGRQVTSFCFPNGKPDDYRIAQVQQIIDAGYRSAVLASPGLVESGTNAYELPRVGISGRSDALSFQKSVDATEYYQARFKRSLGMGNA